MNHHQFQSITTNRMNILWAVFIMMVCALVLTSQPFEVIAQYLVWGFTLNQFLMILVIVVGFAVILLNSVLLSPLKEGDRSPFSAQSPRRKKFFQKATQEGGAKDIIVEARRSQRILRKFSQASVRHATLQYSKKPIYIALYIFLITYIAGVIYNFHIIAYDAAWFDIWSLIHVSICLLLTVILVYWSQNVRLTVGIVVMSGILFEILEYGIQLYMVTLIPKNIIEAWLFDYPAESWINRIADIPFNIIGIIIGYFTVKHAWPAILGAGQKGKRLSMSVPQAQVQEKVIAEAISPTTILSPEDILVWIHQRMEGAGIGSRINEISATNVASIPLDPLNRPLSVIVGKPASTTDLMPLSNYYKRIGVQTMLVVIVIGLLYLIAHFYPAVLDVLINYVRGV